MLFAGLSGLRGKLVQHGRAVQGRAGLGQGGAGRVEGWRQVSRHEGGAYLRAWAGKKLSQAQRYQS